MTTENTSPIPIAPAVTAPNGALLARLWKGADFKPNDSQHRAILHTEGPLFLPAGPGSGKTRVLLWRGINLIANHQLAPQDIYLSTFTEKAALQLRDGLRAMLGALNCDVRFSCDSYRFYACKHRDRNWRKFAAFYDAPADEGEDQDRIAVSVHAVAAAMDAAEDL